MTITAASILAILKSPIMLPVLNLFVVEGMKNLFENVFGKVPNKLMLPIAAGTAAALGEISISDPLLGGVLGLVSSKLHDELMSRKRTPLPAGMVVPSLLILSLLAVGPSSAFAFNETNRVCAVIDADTATVEFRLRVDPATVDPGTPTAGIVVRLVPRSELIATGCQAGAVGLTFGALGVPENKTPGYGIKAVAIDAEGHRSDLSVEVVPSPVPLDLVGPGAPTGVEVH